MCKRKSENILPVLKEIWYLREKKWKWKYTFLNRRQAMRCDRFNSMLMQRIWMISGEGYYPSLAGFQQPSAFEKGSFSTYLTLGRLKSDKAHPSPSPFVTTMRASMNPVIQLGEIDWVLYPSSPTPWSVSIKPFRGTTASYLVVNLFNEREREWTKRKTKKRIEDCRNNPNTRTQLGDTGSIFLHQGKLSI